MELYAGCFLHNLCDENDPDNIMMTRLFNEGYIQGVQVVVKHPSITPDITPENLKDKLVLLAGLKTFVHLGAESAGVDPPERLDMMGVYAKKGVTNGHTWIDWNRETLQWGKTVGEILTAIGHGTGLSDGIIGTTHPGYGWSRDDTGGRKRVIQTFRELGPQIALENVPPAVDKFIFEHYYHEKFDWPFPYYWGFGGTPDDMAALLKEIPGSICLIDFGHLTVMCNQAKHPIMADRLGISRTNLDQVVRDYMELPHSEMCHYSGHPGDYPCDLHGFVHIIPPDPIREALRTMKAVALEIHWNPHNYEGAARAIDDFQKIIQ